MNRTAAITLLLFLGGMVGAAAGMEITPFRTVNQSPLTRIFGLPAESSATLAPKGHFSASLVQDVASNHAENKNAHEEIFLDGESYRWTLAARYGLGNHYEIGIEIPYLLEGGGFLDGFIVDWHKAFSLPQGGRDSAARNRLNYSYRKDGIQKLDMQRAGSGVGDISLTGAIRLYDQHDKDSHDSLALRAALKLPTGDSSSLRGSGSLDTSLFLCGSMNNFTEWGALGLYGSLGGLALTKGSILADQQQNLVGFGTLGIGWGPAEWISFKVQLNGNTAFYNGSTLVELSRGSVVLVSGGALKLPGNYLLDIGVSEDVMVATAPDVAFHLGLSRQF